MMWLPPLPPAVVVMAVEVRDSINAIFLRNNQHWDELSDQNTLTRDAGYRKTDAARVPRVFGRARDGRHCLGHRVATSAGAKAIPIRGGGNVRSRATLDRHVAHTSLSCRSRWTRAQGAGPFFYGSRDLCGRARPRSDGGMGSRLDQCSGARCSRSRLPPGDADSSVSSATGRSSGS